MPFDDFDNEIEKILKSNKKLLVKFEKWLMSKKLSSKTIDKHYQNVDFYINTFLNYSEPTTPDEGWNSIGMYFDYWFIRKAMWSSVEQIKQNAASIKIFYTFLHEINQFEQKNLTNLKKVIKKEMPQWLKNMKAYEQACEEY